MVYEKDDLIIDIYIATNSQNYVVGGDTVPQQFIEDDGDVRIMWVGIAGIYPIRTYTISNNTPYELFTEHHGLVDDTNSWRIIVLDVVGDLNSVLRIVLPLSPYDIDVIIDKEITIYPLSVGSGGSRKESYIQKAKIYNQIINTQLIKKENKK